MPITRDTVSCQLLHMTCPKCKAPVATARHDFIQEREVDRFEYETTITCGWAEVAENKCDHSGRGKGKRPEEAMMNAWWGYQR